MNIQVSLLSRNTVVRMYFLSDKLGTLLKIGEYLNIKTVFENCYNEYEIKYYLCMSHTVLYLNFLSSIKPNKLHKFMHYENRKLFCDECVLLIHLT